MSHSHHNLPAWPVVFSLLFLTSMLWHSLDVPPMSCKIWIITRYLFKKFSSCWLFSMEMSFSYCHPFFQLFTSLCKCKAWIGSIMAMFGARWSQLLSKTILSLVSWRFVAWVTYAVYKMIVRTLCALLLTMKSFGVVNGHIF